MNPSFVLRNGQVDSNLVLPSLSELELSGVYYEREAPSMVSGYSLEGEKLLTMIRHVFSNAEKLAYINAELCLMKKPATLGLPGAKTRYDEFQAIHQLQAYATHFVGAFLPFHRAILHAHESALRTECGYTDWQPYVYCYRNRTIVSNVSQLLARATRCRQVQVQCHIRYGLWFRR